MQLGWIDSSKTERDKGIYKTVIFFLKLPVFWKDRRGGENDPFIYRSAVLYLPKTDAHASRQYSGCFSPHVLIIKMLFVAPNCLADPILDHTRRIANGF